MHWTKLKFVYITRFKEYIIIRLRIWIQMRVLWCFHTSARIYFLSSPNCIYSNKLPDALFLSTSFCCSVFFVGISAWNIYLYISKNIDIPKTLVSLRWSVIMQTWVRSQLGPYGIPCVGLLGIARDVSHSITHNYTWSLGSYRLVVWQLLL
jgi:hypothetical protein